MLWDDHEVILKKITDLLNIIFNNINDKLQQINTNCIHGAKVLNLL